MKTYPSFILNIVLWSISLSLMGQSVVSRQKADQYVFPNPGKQIILVESIPSNQEGLSGRIMNPDNPLYKPVMLEMEYDFHRSMNRINQCVRNLTKNMEGPNILLLSGNEGGFPRIGITITYPDQTQKDFPDLHFVDLVLNEWRIEQGELAIYSHEMGHVLMNQILTDYWDRFPNPTSPKQHVSMGITDCLTAFYEGWGVHFQRHAYDQVEKYRRTFHDQYGPSRAMTMAWHSNLDESLRIMDVETGQYIYEKLLPLGIATDTLSLEEKILFEHTSPVFDPTRIKNAQQMLACEGVVASIFYFITSNSTLQNNYQDISFYKPFLLSDPLDDLSPRDLFTPFENVLLKTVFVWTRMNQEDQPDSPVIGFIKHWCQLFPEDKESLIKTFIYVTKGRTVQNELPALTERINYFGQIGDISQFRQLSNQWIDQYQKVVQSVLEDPNLIGKNVGPEIWIRHPEVMIRNTLWMDEPRSELVINVNTASAAELSAFIDDTLVALLLQKRQSKGFLNLEDIETSAPILLDFLCE